MYKILAIHWICILNDQIIIELDFLKGMKKYEYKKEGKQTLKQKK